MPMRMAFAGTFASSLGAAGRPDVSGSSRCRAPGSTGSWLANAYGHEVGIAEYGMGAILAPNRGVLRADAGLHRGEWESQWSLPAPPPAPQPEPAGKTIGILGYRHIGRALARRARAVDMAVRAMRRDVTRSPAEDRRVPRRV